MFRLGLRRPGDLRGALFLIGLIVVLVFQLSAGIRLINGHGAYETVSILVVVCFVIGISRSWELIGGPSIGIFHEVFTFGRTHTRVGAAISGKSDEPFDADESEDVPDDSSEPEPDYRSERP
jgi:hypothetical protein